MKYPGALLFAFFILNFPFRPHQPSRVTIEHAVTHAERRVTSAHYGRIGGKPSHMFGLKAAVWFNTDENDTNLEDGWH